MAENGDLRAKLRPVFNRFDTDHSGYISMDEMKAICKEVGTDMTPEELKQMFNEADPDGSGEIDFDEFVMALQKQMASGGAFGGLFMRASSLFGILNPLSWFSSSSEQKAPSRPSARLRGEPRSPVRVFGGGIWKVTSKWVAPERMVRFAPTGEKAPPSSYELRRMYEREMLQASRFNTPPGSLRYGLPPRAQVQLQQSSASSASRASNASRSSLTEGLRERYTARLAKVRAGGETPPGQIPLSPAHSALSSASRGSSASFTPGRKLSTMGREQPTPAAPDTAAAKKPADVGTVGGQSEGSDPAHPITAADLRARLRPLFDRIDVDHSGSISIDEMRALCGEIEMELTEAQLQQIFTEADPDGSGEIDLEEFVMAVEKQAGSGGTFGGVLTKTFSLIGMINPFSWFSQ